jgi:hypothetical protein
MYYIPLIYIYYGLAAIAVFILLVFIYQTRMVFELRIRFHGRPGALKRAIKKAKKLHAKDNRRYRVFFLGMRYRVYCRHEIKDYKKAGVFASYINSTTIDSSKFFDTNDLEPCS